MDPEVKSYRLDPAAFEPTLRRRTRRRLSWSLPLLLVLLVPMFALLAQVQPGLKESLPFSLPVVVACLGFGSFRALRLARKNNQAVWDTYQLSLTPNALRRFVSSLPAVEIVRNEVTRILEVPGEGLTVMTADRGRFAFIPEQLQDFAAVHEQLAGWHSFETPNVRRTQVLQLGWTLLLLALWVATGLIPDLRLALLVGLGLLLVGGISLWQTLRLGIPDNRYKARVVGGLCFFMLAPFLRLALYWLGMIWQK